MSRPWIKIHVECLDNPKVATLSLSLRGIWFTTLLIAERFDRDGLLPTADRFALMAHTDEETVEKAFAALVKKGLLEETGDGMKVHDWGDWQGVEYWNTREAWRDRKQRQREKQRMSQDVTRDIVTRHAVTDVTDVTHIDVDRERDTEKEKRDIPPTPSKGNAAKPRPVRTLKTPIPDPFHVTDTMLTWAESKGYDALFIEEATEYFVRWAKAHDHRYAAWDQVWHNVLESKWKERSNGNLRQLRKG